MAKIELTADELGLINRALSDSMNYKPDDRWSEKWSLLLALKQKQLELEESEKALKIKEQTNSEEKSVAEHCPWYETVGRILMILLAVLFLFCIFLALVLAIILFFDEFAGWNVAEWFGTFVMKNPVLAVVLTIGAFFVFLLWFLSDLGKRISRQLN